MITMQLATKLLTPDGYPASFDTGSRAILVPQLGKSVRPVHESNLTFPRLQATTIFHHTGHIVY